MTYLVKSSGKHTPGFDALYEEPPRAPQIGRCAGPWLRARCWLRLLGPLVLQFSMVSLDGKAPGGIPDLAFGPLTEVIMDFEENLFVTIMLVVLFMAGVGICHGIGLGLMWLRDRRSGKKRMYAVRKVL